MQVKCLSVKNPWGYQICAGIKDVENRTWKTDYRGKLYIHSSGGYFLKTLIFESFPKSFHKEINKIVFEDDKAYIGEETKYQKILERIIDVVIEVNKHDKKSSVPFFQHSCIIGSADLVDIVKDSKSPFAEKNQYHWIMKNPVLFQKPIKYIKGKLRFFELDIDPKQKAIKFL